MSSKNSKKATSTGPKVPEPEPIVTRTKSAQQRRQLRTKDTKTDKPELTITKSEIKSPKLNKNVICSKVSLFKNPAKNSNEVEQVEYYPNKLKRDICTKKIMLKPKHNFKVIAATNKRKLATPQKEIKSPPSKKQNSDRSLLKSSISSKINSRPCSSPEMSMQDLVRDMEETQSLNDEDFMEILTCPSPVWWEDPPDARYSEGAIFTRSPESPSPPIKVNKQTNKRKIRTNATSTITNNRAQNIEHNKPTTVQVKNDARFDKKKQKLENILGNIKSKTVKNQEQMKNNEVERNRKVSESTEGDFSDLSFNEEEILKNLENMDIPVEELTKEQIKQPVNTKKEDDVEIKKEKKDNDIAITNELEIKNDKAEIENLPLLKIKSETNDEVSIKSSVSDVDSQDIPDKNFQFSSDVSQEETSSNMDVKTDEIIILDCCTNSNLGHNEDSSSILDATSNPFAEIVKNSPEEQNETSSLHEESSNIENSKFFPNKKIVSDLSEYITIYKIVPEKYKGTNVENTKKQSESNKSKLDNVRGKLDDFFKQCKSNKRLKITQNPSPANPVTAVKEEIIDKENSEKKTGLGEENRLKCCDNCVEKTGNGPTVFSCDEKCEKAPILACDPKNIVVDTKEMYSCKDVARIIWSHKLMLNQT